MSYTLIVGTKEWSSWSLRTYLALCTAGQPFEEVLIRLRETDTGDAIRKFSDAGRVPVLKIALDGESVTVWDSLAICETIAERHPEAGLWPDHWAARAWARAIAAEMHSGFPDLRAQLGLDFAKTLPLPDLRPATREQIARVLSIWETALAQHGQQGGFLFGRFSMADCMFAPVVSRFTTYGVEVSAPAKDYMARIWALPAMQSWRRAAQKEVEDGIA